MAKAASTRSALSKRVRFEVFKRDKFTCQYCGAEAPSVVLHIDHINPVAKGGKNDILNLLTSCAACNGGKGARAISDDSAVSRQRDQLKLLEERRLQIAMMLQWREELASQDDVLVEAASAAWSAALKGWFWNEVGRAKAKAAIKKLGFSAVMNAIEGVRERYPAAAVEQPTHEVMSAATAHYKTLLKYGTDTNGQQMAYVIGILRNRCSGTPQVFHADLRGWHDQGVSIAHMTDVAKTARSWAEFIVCMDEAATNG
jgi:hypothetical protein